MQHRIFSILLVVGLAACSVSADTERAEQAIQHFHERLDAGQSAAIYDAAAEDLKAVSTQSDFVAFLDAVHRKLGLSKSSSQKGWNVNYGTSGKFITLNYETAFAEGQATEQFLYRLSDGKALLAGYHINSNAFILK
jgi:hypothetical protein